MDKFLETCNLPRLNHNEIEKLNRMITSNKIESVILKKSKSKSLGPDDFKKNSIKPLKKS